MKAEAKSPEVKMKCVKTWARNRTNMTVVRQNTHIAWLNCKERNRYVS